MHPSFPSPLPPRKQRLAYICSTWLTAWRPSSDRRRTNTAQNDDSGSPVTQANSLGAPPGGVSRHCRAFNVQRRRSLSS